MEVMAELNTEFFDDSAPAVGPGGLVNLSRVSRDLSKGQSTKDEALRALPPPPPPPQKKRSDLYGPGVGARGPGSARDADDAAAAARDAPAAPAAPAATPAKKTPAAAPKTPQERALRDALEAEDLRAAPLSPARPPPRTRATRSERRAASLVVVAAHVYAAKRCGGRVAPVAAAGGLALAYALRRHDDDGALAAARGRVAGAATRALDGAARLGALAVGAGRRGHALARDRAPAALVAVATAFVGWRAAGLALGAAEAAAYLRLAAALLAAVVGAVLAGRGAPEALARGASGLVAAYAASAGLDAAAGPDATASLLALAWLSKPDVDGLRRRLDPDRAGPGPPLRARDFGAAVVCARAAGDLEDRGDVYLGVFGTWFACRDAGVAKLD